MAHSKLSDFQGGYIPDFPDFRDLSYAAPAPIVRALPDFVNLYYSGQVASLVFDQVATSSCVGQSVAKAVNSGLIIQQAKNIYVPSRAFIYYNARKIRGIEKLDKGCMIRDAIKSVNQTGVVAEDKFPFTVENMLAKPPLALYKESQKHQVVKYMRIPRRLSQIRGCLADGYPFIFGFSVYDSFYSDDVITKGIAQMPTADDKFLGGHAVLAVGYDANTARIICLNSWSEYWGAKGLFTLPDAYLLNRDLSDDFWVVQLVEDS